MKKNICDSEMLTTYKKVRKIPYFLVDKTTVNRWPRISYEIERHKLNTILKVHIILLSKNTNMCQSFNVQAVNKMGFVHLNIKGCFRE